MPKLKNVVEPDAEDFAAAELKYGQLANDAGDTERAKRYLFAQAHKLIRTAQLKLPLR
jgi:hypothetical protein